MGQHCNRKPDPGRTLQSPWLPWPSRGGGGQLGSAPHWLESSVQGLRKTFTHWCARVPFLTSGQPSQKTSVVHDALLFLFDATQHKNVFHLFFPMVQQKIDCGFQPHLFRNMCRKINFFLSFSPLQMCSAPCFKMQKGLH